jgi:hypothetical protein
LITILGLLKTSSIRATSSSPKIRFARASEPALLA